MEERRGAGDALVRGPEEGRAQAPESIANFLALASLSLFFSLSSSSHRRYVRLSWEWPIGS